jgi:hypothetical protein
MFGLLKNGGLTAAVMCMQEAIGQLRHMRDGSGFPVTGKNTMNTGNTGLPVIGENLKRSVRLKAK